MNYTILYVIQGSLGSRNLPYTVDDVRKVNAGCRICAECKPRFYQPLDRVKLIKATQPFERLNLDVKGPLPSESKNKYILTVVDEYSRYPFAIPCADVSAQTVFKECCNLCRYLTKRRMNQMHDSEIIDKTCLQQAL